MGVLDANRFRLVMCWKRFLWIPRLQVRNGTATAAKLSELRNCASRRFQTWCCRKILRLVLTDVANELRENGALDEEDCFIDATFVMAKGGRSEIGPTKRGKGMKIMAIVDRRSVAAFSVSTHAANHHEVRLVQLCFDFYMIEGQAGEFDRRSRLRQRSAG